MVRPKLQLALDHNTLEEALADCYQVGETVDIIEIGTILCLQEGEKAIRCIRKMFPKKRIIADTKCADAGATVANNVAKAGADEMTVICCASIPTMQAAQKEVNEIQVELYGDWTFEQARKWREIGINQVIYHQSRDALFAGESWGKKDLEKVRKLIALDFQVAVTGGLTVDNLALFHDLPISTFITGRSITAAAEPKQAAEKFMQEIIRLWGQ